ncbi:PAS domain S-box protein [Litoribacter alkaliphilus]|uniref:PAS domain S-box protein n=1 Tax=Litoribacter ruber TaxID=702568 RepID=A0AAP2CKY2_9BACT|nr:PAS domain S-box protein [Litoribacter alkaliphilus]MBS9525820.1 PAS domain S-box protein [Litoribacter alkaliphilus]
MSTSQLGYSWIDSPKKVKPFPPARPKCRTIQSLDVFAQSDYSNNISLQALPNVPSGKVPFLHCYDVIAMNRVNEKVRQQDVQELKRLGHRFAWDLNWSNVLHMPYEALVLTDVNTNIMWTCSGFEIMTGYSSSYALGKKPSFLQGPSTRKERIKDFRQNLDQEIEFEMQLTNHRKSGEAYECLVHILPLIGLRGNVTHFLAVEREVA